MTNQGDDKNGHLHIFRAKTHIFTNARNFHAEDRTHSLMNYSTCDTGGGGGKPFFE